MEVRALGPLEVFVGGQRVPLTRQLLRALLALLVLRAGRVVSTDSLLDDLWGETPPPTAKSSLQNAVSALRRLLGPEVVQTRAPGYILKIDADRVDLLRFERLLAEAARTGDARRRGEKLRQALALWRGPPLADVVLEASVQGEIARLEELRAGAEEDLADVELARGAGAELVPRLEALVAEYPLRERLRAQLMHALYRAGRQADALECFRQARELLVDELGLEPSPALRRREQAILRQDPELAPQDESAALAGAWPRERRKRVTVLLSEAAASTDGALPDPERMRLVLGRYFAEARAAIELHGGTVEWFAADEVMAVFGVPEAHEDDALRAVRAASAMREVLATLNEDLAAEQCPRLEARAALTTGEVVAGEGRAGEPLVTGEPVSLARRLEQVSAPGEILLGATTLGLVRDAVDAEALAPISLRGSARPLQAFRLLGVRPGAFAPSRHPEAPFVGRARELARLCDAFADVEKSGGCRTLALIGEAGIGKSRLAAELGSSLGSRACLLAGHCVPYGHGATYLPLRELVAAAIPEPSQAALVELLAGEPEAELVAQRVAELVGLAETRSSGEEAFWAVRRLLAALARPRPLVLVLEDLHWAEPTFLDLIDYVARWSSGSPILVLCLARPELLDVRPEWRDGCLELEPLDEQVCAELLVNLGAVDPGLRDGIVATAEGNPLFAEQLLAFAAEHGGSLPTVPPTIDALLTSRLDRLAPSERGVLERAAVVGREFRRAAVIDLLPPESIGAIGRDLHALERKQLIHGAGRTAPRDDAFAFHHALIRDVAYAGIPKGVRADLHERLADWLDQRPDSSIEVVGYHLEQAARYCGELGGMDARARRLSAEAGRKLGDAGLRAWKRADAAATVNLLSRATTLLPPDPHTSGELLCELGIALFSAGALEEAEHVLKGAAAMAVAAGDRRLELRSRLEIAYRRLEGDPEASVDELLEIADEAVPVFEALGDDRALGRTWLLVGYVQGGLRCRSSLQEEALARAVFHYRRSGWPTSTCIGELAASLYFGATPVPDAIARCESLLQEAGSAPSAEANVLVYLGGLRAMLGEFAESRQLLERARRTYAELGLALVAVTYAAAVSADIESLCGDHAGAEQRLRELYDASVRMNDRAHAATWAAQLAEAIYAQGRRDEAKRWSVVAEELALQDDVGVQTAWRCVRAKVLAGGTAAEADDLVGAAAALAEGMETLNQKAKVYLDLGEVQLLQGRVEEATAFLTRAVDLYERKGNLVSAARARSVLSEPLPT